MATRKRVIVVGQGVAGLTAAYAAAKHGAQVISISKTRPGTATCTAYAGGGFTLGIDGVTPQEHYQMTLDTGRHLNITELLEYFSNNAPTVVQLLEEIRVNYKRRPGGLGIVRDPNFPLLGGKPLLDALIKACTDLGVLFHSGLFAWRILTNNSGVNGLECIDLRRAQPVTLEADAVVLATGGAGRLYNRTDNPRRITGDGYRLVLESGLELIDMEFVQFYPLGLDITPRTHWFIDLSILDSARLTDSSGKEFIRDLWRDWGISSGREANLLARDRCAVAIAREVRRGTVLLHLEDISQKDWGTHPYLKSIARLFPEDKPAWSQPVEVHPIQHYFPGGVPIGTFADTGIPGLFAAGECTGGVDGANRVGGNALTNCMLFGLRAGESAAGLHGSHELHRSPWLNHSTPSVEEPLRLESPELLSAQDVLLKLKEGYLGPECLKTALSYLASQALEPVRNRLGLESAVSRLAELRGKLAVQGCANEYDLLTALENFSLWYTAAAVTLAANLRTESRGAHFREDYPNEDPQWVKHVYVSKETGSIVARVSR